MCALSVQHERREGHRLELLLHRFVDDEVTPSGHIALLLHGYLDAAGSWEQVAARLAARGLEVLAPDLRGFGRSDRLGRGGYYHFPDYVADVDALVAQLDPNHELVLVGHSMGGSIACMYAGSRPERIHKLVLLEGVGPPAMPPELAVTRMRRWLDQMKRPRQPKPLASLEDAAQRLALHHPRLDIELLERRAEHLTERDGQGVLRWAHDPMHRTTAPSAFQAEVFMAFLAQITCPVLFIDGGPLGWHPADEQQRLDALPHRPTRVLLEDAGHMMHWTRPELVANAIVDFVLRHERTAED